MEIYVRTRGWPRGNDYQFLGEAPEDFWWRSYGPVTDVERPTILLRSDGTSWQAYIAGIRSGRLDSTENAIQFNLVLAGDCGAEEENATALSVITRSAAGLAEQGAQFIPGDPLDEQLPADEVERMLTSPGKQTAAVAGAAVRAAYPPGGSVPPAAPGPAQAGPDLTDAGPGLPDGDWIGGLAGPQALDAFAALVARLLDSGHAGRAAVLNLVADDGDLDGLPAWDGQLGALGARPGPHLEMAVRTLGKDQPLPDTETRREPPGRLVTGRRAALILVGVAGAVVMAILIDWLVRMSSQHPHR